MVPPRGVCAPSSAIVVCEDAAVCSCVLCLEGALARNRPALLSAVSFTSSFHQTVFVAVRPSFHIANDCRGTTENVPISVNRRTDARPGVVRFSSVLPQVYCVFRTRGYAVCLKQTTRNADDTLRV